MKNAKQNSELLQKSFEKSNNWRHISSDGTEVYQYNYVDVRYTENDCEIHYTIMRSCSDVTKPMTTKHSIKRWCKVLSERWNDGKELWKLYDTNEAFEKAILRIEKLIAKHNENIIAVN